MPRRILNNVENKNLYEYFIYQFYWSLSSTRYFDLCVCPKNAFDREKQITRLYAAGETK